MMFQTRRNDYFRVAIRKKRNLSAKDFDFAGISSKINMEIFNDLRRQRVSGSFFDYFVQIYSHGCGNKGNEQLFIHFLKK